MAASTRARQSSTLPPGVPTCARHTITSVGHTVTRVRHTVTSVQHTDDECKAHCNDSSRWQLSGGVGASRRRWRPLHRRDSPPHCCRKPGLSTVGLSLSLSHTHTHSFSLSLSLSLSLSFFLFLSLFVSLSHTHTLTHTLSVGWGRTNRWWTGCSTRAPLSPPAPRYPV